MVALIAFDDRFAVIDAARGHADQETDGDAYLNGGVLPASLHDVTLPAG